MMRGKLPHPYVMRGQAAPRLRATAEDAPDYRVVRPPLRRLSAAEVHAITRPGMTSERFLSADRWLERWAATHGTGRMLPLIATLKLRAPTPKVPPLDDHDSLLIDTAVRFSPSWASTFAVLWYRSDYTVQQITELLKIRSRRAVYEERNAVLAYYLGRFTQGGLQVTFWTDPV